LSIQAHRLLSKYTWERVLKNPLLWLTVLTLSALVARTYHLAGPVLRWDEGWSLAHASLSWPEVISIGSEEWHPPLYIALLKLWLILGSNAWVIRFFSVAIGTLTVPIAYKVAVKWSGRLQVGLLAAVFAAFAPLLVYYGQVTRMYALSALAVLLATWFMLTDEAKPSWASLAGLVIASIVSLYSFYLTAWALIGLGLYGVIARPGRIPRLLLAGLLVVAAYLPWLWFTRSNLAQRLSGTPLLGPEALSQTLGYLRPVLDGLVFVYGARSFVAPVVWIILVAGIAVGIWQRTILKPLLLPLCVLTIGIAGAAFSARVYWFAVRHLMPIVGFLGLLLAWALDRLTRLWWPLLLAAFLVLALAYWPVSTRFVYEKTLEVTDAFDPTADYQYLESRADRDDLVYFNVLAHAGWYETYRHPDDAHWSYALRWDPIIEPVTTIAKRIEQQTTTQQRFWFILYKGDYGSNAELVTWLNQNLYPAGAEWQGDMLYLAFTRPGVEWVTNVNKQTFGETFSLWSARWSAQTSANNALAMELTWSISSQVNGDYKVFVHLVTDEGRLVAQHDGLPASGLIPVTSWQVDQKVTDHHGLFMPRDNLPPGTRLHLLVGIYNAQTGERLRTAAGLDAVELGITTIN
jgi:hypothetical protein